MAALTHELIDEDEGDGEGGDPADEEEEGGEKPAGIADSMVIGELVDDEALGQAPADEEAENDAAEGHNPQSGDIVESIEEAAPEEGAEVAQKSEGQRAERCEDDGRDGHDGGGTTA